MVHRYVTFNVRQHCVADGALRARQMHDAATAEGVRIEKTTVVIARNWRRSGDAYGKFGIDFRKNYERLTKSRHRLSRSKGKPSRQRLRSDVIRLGNLKT